MSMFESEDDQSYDPYSSYDPHKMHTALPGVKSTSELAMEINSPVRTSQPVLQPITTHHEIETPLVATQEIDPMTLADTVKEWNINALEQAHENLGRLVAYKKYYSILREVVKRPGRLWKNPKSGICLIVLDEPLYANPEKYLAFIMDTQANVKSALANPAHILTIHEGTIADIQNHIISWLTEINEFVIQPLSDALFWLTGENPELFIAFNEENIDDSEEIIEPGQFSEPETTDQTMGTRVASDTGTGAGSRGKTPSGGNEV